MAEKLNPLTNLPDKDKPSVVRGSDFFKLTPGSGVVDIDARKELAPTDISEFIQSKSNKHEMRLLKPEELKFGADWDQLMKTKEARLQDARVSRMEELDENQTWGAGLNAAGKFVGKTVNRTVLGLVGTVYGAGKALFSFAGNDGFSADAILDNNILRASDEIDGWLNANLPIYTNEDKYAEKGFLGKLAYHPGKLFGDEVADAVSFSISAIAQEVLFTAITAGSGGTGIGIQAAGTANLVARGSKIFNKFGAASKLLKGARGLDKSADALKMVDALSKSGRAAERASMWNQTAGTAKSLFIGSNYEAGIEARQNYDEVKGHLIEEYKNLNGEEPTGADMAQIEEAANASKWWTYGGNMAVLGASNLIQFPSIFKKGYRGERELAKVSKHLSQVDGKFVNKLADEKGFIKAAKKGYAILKNPVSESLEETTQGIINGTTADYYTRKYSFEENKESVSFVESFGRASEEFFGSAEGSTSMGIGFLVGALGLPMGRSRAKGGEGRIVGGVTEGLREFKNKRSNIDSVAEMLNNSDATTSMKANFENFVNNTSIQKDMDSAIDAGDLFSYKNLEHDQFYSYIRSRLKVGMSEIVDADLDAMEKMPLEEFAKEFGLPEVAEFTEERKKQVIEQAREFVGRVRESSRVVDAIIDRNKHTVKNFDSVRESLIHAASTIEDTSKREEELISKIEEITGGNITGAEIASIADATEHKPVFDTLAKIISKEKSGEKLTPAEKATKTKTLKKYNIKKDALDSMMESESLDYDSLRSISSTPKARIQTQGNKSPFYMNSTDFLKQAEESINSWANANQAKATVYGPEVSDMLLDIAKLKNRREAFAQMYNHLQTKEGAAELQELNIEASEMLDKQMRANVASEEAEAVKNAKNAADMAHAKDKAAANGNSERTTKAQAEKANKQSRDVKAYNPEDITNSLLERYNGNPELFEKEKGQLIDTLNEHLGIEWFKAENFTWENDNPNNDFIKRIISESTTGGKADVINAFYANAATEIYETDSDSKAEYRDPETPSDEVIDGKLVLGSRTTEIYEDPMRSQAPQFKMHRATDGSWKFTLDQDLNTIPVENFLKVDFDYVNSPENLNPGASVELSIDLVGLESDYHKQLIKDGKFANGFQILVTTTDKDGNRVRVGGLSSHVEAVKNADNKKANDSILEIREAILAELVSAEAINSKFEVVADTRNLIHTGFTSTVDTKGAGRINAIRSQKTFEEQVPVGDSLSNGEELLFGIAVPSPDGATIKVPNSSKTAAPVASGLVVGAVYSMRKASDGSYLPVRLTTRNINDSDMSSITPILNDLTAMSSREDAKEFNDLKDKLNEFVYADVADISTDGQIKFRKYSPIGGKNEYTDFLSIEEAQEYLKGKNAQISLKSLNSKGYNQSIDGNKVRTNVPNAGSNGAATHSATISMNKWTSKTENLKKNNPRTELDVPVAGPGATKTDSFFGAGPLTDEPVAPKPRTGKSKPSSGRSGRANILKSEDNFNRGKKEFEASIKGNTQAESLAKFALAEGGSFASAAMLVKIAGVKVELTETQKRHDASLESVDLTYLDASASLSKYGLKKDTKYDVSEISDILDRLKINDQSKKIFNSIREAAAGLGVTIQFSDNVDSNTATGTYNLSTHTIKISTDKLNYDSEGVSEVIVHEMVHGVTRYITNTVQEQQGRGYAQGYSELTQKQIDGVNNLNVILTELQKDKSLSSEYGLTNIDELLAELANPRFVKKLKDKKFNKKSILSQIVSSIAKILGIKTSGYDLVNEQLEALISTPNLNLLNISGTSYTKGILSEKSIKSSSQRSGKAKPKFKFSEAKFGGDWDEAASTAWMEQNLPGIPFEVVENISYIADTGGEHAWGVFKDASIYIAKDAGKGTAYHEAFHAVFDLYLTDSQRAKIMIEAQAEYGSDTDLDIEEDLADAFADYISEGKAPNKSGIRRFFANLWRFIKGITGTRTLKIDSLFEAINDGYYGDKSVGDLIGKNNKFANNPKFKKVPGMNVAQKRNRVNMINSYFLTALEELSEYHPDMTHSEILKTYGVKNMFSNFTDSELPVENVHDRLYTVYEEIKEDYKENPSKENEYAVKQMSLTLNNFIKGTDADGNFIVGSLFEDSLKGLRKYGIKIDARKVDKSKVELEEGFSDDIAFDEADTFESWQVNRASISTKDTTSYKVKHELSKLYEQEEAEDGDLINKTDDLGFDMRLDFDQVFNSLKGSLTELTTIDDMMAKMIANYKARPHYKDIVNKLKLDKEFRAAFFHTMATQRQDSLLLLSTIHKGQHADSVTVEIIDSNRRKPENILKNEWSSLFTRTVLDAKGNVNLTKVKSAKKSIEESLKGIKAKRKDSLHINSANSISKALNNVGIDISAKELQTMYRGTESATAHQVFADAFESDGLFEFVISPMLKNKNPYITKTDTGRMNKALKPFVDAAVDTRPAVYEQGSINVEGKQVFANLSPNHLSRLITSLKDKDSDATIDFYQQDNFYKRSGWLNRLKDFKDTRDILNRKVLDGIKDKGRDFGVKYTGMSPLDRKVAELNAFNNQAHKSVAYYTVPILADAPQLNLISFEKYSQEELLEKFYEVALQEAERNAWIKADTAKESSDPTKVGVKNYSEGFYYFKGLGSVANITSPESKGKVLEVIQANLDKEFAKTFKQLKDLEIITEPAKGFLSAGKSLDKNIGGMKLHDFITSYVNNALYANIQMIQIFSGDSAFYKSDADLSKRNKQITNPGNVLDISSMKSDKYKTIYLLDEERPSTFLKGYRAVLKGVDGAKDIIDQYAAEDGVNQTDAQAYISLDRYREIMKGAGMWTNKHDQAYESLASGVATPEELSLVMQPIKPFYFGKTLVDNKIIPVQNKNAEFLLLPQFAKGNPKLEKLIEMFDQGISSVQFESAVKVGQRNLLDFSDIESSNDLTTLLNNKNIELDNADYRIQLSVPEHHLDSSVLFGTQIRRIAVAQLKMNDPNHKYTVDGREVSAEELFDEYQDVIYKDLEEAFNELETVFDTNDRTQLREMLLDSVIERGLGQKYEDALELDENNQFKFPLYFPLAAKKNEAMITSLFKNRVTKQKIKGGTFVQVSDFGLSQDLGYELNEDGTVGYMEAILPWWSKKFFPKNEDGTVDFTRVPQELREMIGFRTPTEDKYSIPLIRVVGFSPQEAGGVIILPADITRRAGTDFDVDKLTLMMYEFKTKIDFDKMREESFPQATTAKLEMVSKKHIDELIGSDRLIKELMDLIKSDYAVISKVPSGMDSKEARNNLKIDIIKGVLSNKAHAAEVLNPGSFDTLKAASVRINSYYKIKAGDIQMHSPADQLELFARNMAGKNMIPVFANHNSNHAMTQHTEFGMSSKIKFNGQEKTLLNGTMSSDVQSPKTIARTLAEFLAASVDNAKDPVLSSLNINKFTADTVAMIVRSGYDLDTALDYINQPVIKDFATRFVNAGGMENNFDRIYEAIKNDLISKGAKEKVDETGKSISKHFNLSRGSSQVSGGLINAMKQGDNADVTSQLIVLETFSKYRDMAKGLSQFVSATRADSKGAEPSMAANEVSITRIKDVKDSEKLVGVAAIFAGDKYKMLSGFTNFGLVKPHEMMKTLFPWSNSTFSSVKDTISTDKGSPLNEKEIDFVNNSLLRHIASKYEFYNMNREEVKELTLELPAQLLDRIANDPELKDNLFTGALNIEVINPKKEEAFQLPRITFNNAARLSDLQKEQVEEAFEELLESDKYKDIAEDLIKYSFASSGFAFTPNSFNHLIPISFFESLRDSNGTTFYDYLKVNIDTPQDTFLSDFYRNNYDRFSFLPEVERGEDVKFENIKYDNTFMTPISMEIDLSELEGTSLASTDSDGLVTFKDMAVMQSGYDSYLMKLGATDGLGKAIYYHVPRLGKKNYLIESTDEDGKGSILSENIVKFELSNEDGSDRTITWASGSVAGLMSVLQRDGLGKYIHTSNDISGQSTSEGTKKAVPLQAKEDVKTEVKEASSTMNMFGATAESQAEANTWYNDENINDTECPM